MMMAKKKDKPRGGCLVPILTVLGFLVICFVFCYVLYLLNLPYLTPTTTTTEGGTVLPLLPTIF